MNKISWFERHSALRKRLASGILSVLLLVSSSHPHPVLAGTTMLTSTTPGIAVVSGVVLPSFDLPERPQTIRAYRVDVTAYTSSVEECDSDPFTTADGSTTSDGIIATNFLPFKTKVRLPQLFGQKVFEVHDRMHPRFSQRIDVWMEKKADMREFGIKRNVLVEVIEWGDGQTQWNKKLAMK